MTGYLLLPQRRMKTREIDSCRGLSGCPACNGRMLRLAERESRPPYHWIPTGYVCSKCNVIVLEDN